MRLGNSELVDSMITDGLWDPYSDVHMGSGSLGLPAESLDGLRPILTVSIGRDVYAVGEPPPRGESRRIEDNGDAAEAILEYLAEKKLI